MFNGSSQWAGGSARSRLVPWAIILLFVGVSFAYSLVVPPFETPDELYHYAFARHLALGNALPVQTVEANGPWEHEGTQAPLYYLLLGRLIAPVNHSDFDTLVHTNPRANLGDPLYPGNKNFMLYSTRTLPLQGTNLAVHIGRWFSILLSALTLWFIYKIARLAFPTAPDLALAGLLIPATIPQFAFISASVSNDALVVLLCTVTLYCLTALLNRPPTLPITWRSWLLLGALLGLAALSKLPALGLLPLTGLVLVALAWRRRDWMLPLRAAPILALVFLLIAGWWYWRNFTLYGDPLAVDTLLEIEGLRTEPTAWGRFWGELRGLRYSFWGIFGWFSILLPAWIYRLLDWVTLLALGGLLLGALRAVRGGSWRRELAQPTRLVWLCLAMWGALLLALMLYWLTFAISSQGRLLFPGLAAYSVLLVLGLHSILHPTGALLRRIVPRVRAILPSIALLYALPAGLLATSIFVLLALLPPSYRAAPPVTAIPATAQPVERVYGGEIEVVAVEVPPGPYTPETPVPVTLYLRKLHETGEDYQIFVQLLDQELKEIANVTSHPGWGKNPTTLWEVGKVYPDHYDLTLLRAAAGDQPIEARLYVGFMDEQGTLLEVPGYEWDIASRTIGYVLVN